MTIHISTDAAFADIPTSGLLEPPVAEPLTPPIETWTRELFATTDGASSAGFWEVAPGTSRWEFTDYSEIIYITAGEMTVTETGGESVHLGPGDAAVFPVGWQGEWDAPDGLRKFYVVIPG